VHFTPQQLFDLTIGRRRANHDAVIEVSDPPKQRPKVSFSQKDLLAERNGRCFNSVRNVG
jgi:hypothetical protein